MRRNDGRRRRKEELRRRLREARGAIPAEERTRLSREITGRLFALPEMEAARTVALFSSFGSEVDTAPMIRRAHEEGRRVLLPYLDEDRMELGEHRPGDKLVRSSYGAGEPADRVPVDPAEVEVVVLPGLAFDRLGRRLGYGGGYYDRWLRRARPDVPLIGVAFSAQIVDRVPASSSDARVRVVVTDREVIRVRGDASVPPL